MTDVNGPTHPLLKRQLKKYPPPDNSSDRIDQSFIQMVNETYWADDEERKLLERSLEISSEELMQKNSQIRTIFQALPDIFLRIDLDGKILDHKTASMNISKLFPDQMIGKNIQDIEVFQINVSLQEAVERVKATDEVVTFENCVDHEGKKIYFEARVKSLLKDQAIIVIRDITERKIAEEQLRIGALYDRLTQLPNRVLLLDRLNSFIERHTRNAGYNFGVLFIDFDRFKLVNDSLGHQVGDDVLVGIGQRLAQSLRGVDTVARLGGDEFCVILDDVKTGKDAITVTERIQKLISAPFVIGNKEIFLTLSAGITISSDQEEKSAEEYIREADIAMYNAKKNGRAQYAVFTQEMRQRSINRLDLEADLRRAVENNEFILYYQPIVSLPDNKIVRMEALVRWVHPQKGMILPLEFIPLAEETGLILPISGIVLQNACIQCRDWQKQGFPDLSVAVNFSISQFHYINMLELIQKTMTKLDFDPSHLEMEITESVAMKNVYYTIETIKKLKDMKVRVTIDDFGTGYSSLDSLSELPIDSLKIDRKFIMNLPANAHGGSLTTAIINLAHNLGLKVVAEGVETKEQQQFLLDNQCDEGQGYFFSQALPADEAFAILKKH